MTQVLSSSRHNIQYEPYSEKYLIQLAGIGIRTLNPRVNTITVGRISVTRFGTILHFGEIFKFLTKIDGFISKY